MQLSVSSLEEGRPSVLHSLLWVIYAWLGIDGREFLIGQAGFGNGGCLLSGLEFPGEFVIWVSRAVQ